MNMNRFFQYVSKSITLSLFPNYSVLPLSELTSTSLSQQLSNIIDIQPDNCKFIVSVVGIIHYEESGERFFSLAPYTIINNDYHISAFTERCINQSNLLENQYIDETTELIQHIDYYLKYSYFIVTNTPLNPNINTKTNTNTNPNPDSHFNDNGNVNVNVNVNVKGNDNGNGNCNGNGHGNGNGIVKSSSSSYSNLSSTLVTPTSLLLSNTAMTEQMFNDNTNPNPNTNTNTNTNSNFNSNSNYNTIFDKSLPIDQKQSSNFMVSIDEKPAVAKVSQLSQLDSTYSNDDTNLITLRSYFVNRTTIANNLYIPNHPNLSYWFNWYQISETQYKLHNSTITCHITYTHDNNTSVKSFYNLDSHIINVVDVIISNNTFERSFKNKKLTICDGVIQCSSYQYNLHKLKPLQCVAYIDHDLIYTLDIECLIINNSFIPYAICLYNGKSNHIEYGLDCISKMVNYILSLNCNMNIYVHNLDHFDSKYLLKELLLTKHAMKFIPSSSGANNDLTSFYLYNKVESAVSKTGKFTSKTYIISFIDSYKLLPFSLSKLSKSFHLDGLTKGIFPYQFMDSIDKIHYHSDKPLLSYYDNQINYDEYKTLPNLWNAEFETKKYISLDCILLYKILSTFLINMNDNYGINSLTKVSLPSLTMAIYRTKFYDETITPIVKLNVELDTDIRQSYYGGVVDVYQPYLTNGYYYDINSLYPYAMLRDMPIGQPRVIRGDIKLDEFFGFLYVEIQTPENMKIPYLTYRINTNNILSPLGSWKGWYFSEELKYAKTLGYNIKILSKGYAFDRGLPFNDFVNTFYDLKKNTDDEVERFLAKLLLNSLYGKFGMSLSSKSIEKLTRESLNAILNKNDNITFDMIFDFEDLNDDICLVNIDYNKVKSTFTNVAIASAITAYARIIMDPYKRLTDNNCYYSDTDSIFVQKPLDSYMINNDIGFMKLEHKIKSAVFIAPKVYGFITEDNKEIIKIKGFDSNHIKFDDMVKLLDPTYTYKYKLNIFKRTSDKVYFHEILKTLTNTLSNKRIPIIKDGIIIDTKPHII
jgi:hypothetical protein